MQRTKTARIALDTDGVIVVRICKDARQKPDDARQNLEACLAEGAGRRRPLLIDIRESQPLDAETRHLYSGQTLTDAFTALALLVEASPLGKMMGNVYFRVARPGIPTRLFTEERAAFDWAKTYLE